MAALYNGTYVYPARSRLTDDYNFAGYPSVFFDGGAEVVVGGTSQWGPFTSRILSTGSRPVMPLNFLVSTRHMGGSDYEVRVRIGNGVPANNPPPDPDIPSGPDSGYPDSSLQFDCSVADPDADDGMYYDWDWGDGQTSDETLGAMPPFAAPAIPDAIAPGLFPWAFTNPILIDADGGDWTPPGL